MKRLAALCLLAALCPALTLAGQADQSGQVKSARAALDAKRAAERAARTQEQADTAKAALLAQQQVAAAAALRQLESQTSQDAQQLAALQAAQAATGQRLVAAQSALAKLLPAMQRLEAQPAATMLAAPQSPQDAVRGIAIMQGVAAAIAAQAEDVREQTSKLASLLSQAQASQARLSAAVSSQQNAEAALSAQINSAKAAEMADADTVAKATEARLAAERKLKSIAAAVASLMTNTAAPENLRAGAGGAPVAGHIAQAFGAPTPAGPATGISYDAAPGARVTTPCGGTVLFAGPFPAYGLMLIANCGGGNSVVLAGMDHLDVATGQHLTHGQPVGSMLGYDPANPTRQPILYIELRQNGTPVNPAAWLSGNGSG
ncbi:membrane protein [Acidocella aquatica]|uniref:Membrane protein n=1 Tax=Acidocella aquatica TaxID=1922313 RepID=A0ABQ6ABV5_9PROT|nr:peptidoglycan DD-metalloendopeptidase family protein [Acidocella aquatica]GLR68802.1 membrane protein [Acidocella aquatica]